MKRLRVFVGLVIVGIALFSSWLLKSLDQLPLLSPERPRHEADFYLTGVETTVLNKQGKPFYQLSSVQVVHYPDTMTMELEKPELSLLSTPEKWRLHARKGRIWGKQELIELEDEVLITGDAGPNMAPFRLETRNLTLNMQDKYAETKTEVKITMGTDTIKAHGMLLDMKDGHLEFMGNVQGNFH